MEDTPTSKLLIYGANGYTGQLICEEAARQGLEPVLAGRSERSIAQLGEKYGWEYRIFSLDTVEVITSQLNGISAVLHAAGPFKFTAKNMLEACLQKGVHYLDITGEMEVFAMANGMHEQAVQRNIMLMPGTGFDVVPTDCMALSLKEKMPDAISLELAFVTLGGQISHGTAMSMSEKLGEGGASRINDKIVREPIGHKGKTLTLYGKDYKVMSIPWGDVYTAYHTTGIGNIRAYTGTTLLTFNLLKLQALFNPLLRTSWFKKWLQKKINAGPAGPSSEKRAKAITYVWGEVSNAAGKQLSDYFKCPDGYTLTALASVYIAESVLKGDWKPGYQTPAGCYGASLVDRFKRV